MLEKIGLKAKPSLGGNTWVVDASHSQGCTSQFTFVNRQHHCRRCGGLFCNSCTQQRMFFTRARQFEVESKPEDEVLNQSERSENS
ncbi:E3 ubiquitin-protein ligase PIB1-like [Prunus avium]|uniref:E3 ubiquitin-protein ligase PIB1-like n=1 Tax=Prunus avium TaxID=42229 RepID=A0A6P5TF37_PRUAV|nr:E3 ubiquitin-protein ligase PIB1-like [Prunus avium]XP_021825869.1 E3 ubiquitin-protein ligase PIB1-like [Prunus avium]